MPGFGGDDAGVAAVKRRGKIGKPSSEHLAKVAAVRAANAIKPAGTSRKVSKRTAIAK